MRDPQVTATLIAKQAQADGNSRTLCDMYKDAFPFIINRESKEFVQRVNNHNLFLNFHLCIVNKL